MLIDASNRPTVGVTAAERFKPVRLLLINPRSPDSFWSFRWAMEHVMVDQRVPNPPLGLATLAALCPDHWVVTIVDEAVEPLPMHPDVDLVGVCGMGVQHPRQRELLSLYRSQGYYTVAGGSFASLCPEELQGLADTVVAGEAEYIWPRFCADYEAGRPERVYVETGTVDIAHVPTPRFDLLDLSRYGTASLQFSRGCPYQCEFCDIIVMFGRKPRTKAPEQIGRELDALRAQGATSAFFVDDNLIGNRKTAKALLRYLVAYQKQHNYPFTFGTEASLNLAEDPEMLDLFREARFAWVFLGIETPDVDSLRAAGKVQNTRSDLLTSVRAIYAHGIDVFAGFIIGFDNDTEAAFERQYRFIVDAGIQVAMVGLLTALPRTPLYDRLAAEGRLCPDVQPGDNTKANTNVLPLSMSYDAMTRGYKALHRRLSSNRGIANRIRAKTRYLRRPIGHQAPASPIVAGKQLARVLIHGVLPGGPARWFHFARSLGCHPRLWPLVISDWVRGLSMRAYVREHFQPDTRSAWRRAELVVARLQRRFREAFERGRAEADLAPLDGDPHVRLSINGVLGTDFFRHCERALSGLLRRPRATLTLDIRSICDSERAELDRLLARLTRYGEKVRVRVNEDLSLLTSIDPTRVCLVFPKVAAGT